MYRKLTRTYISSLFKKPDFFRRTSSQLKLFLICSILFCLPISKVSAAFTLTFQVSNYNGFQISCPGANDGSIDMTINGGNAPFDILWSNSEVTEDISSLQAGQFIVRVIDAVQDTVIDTLNLNEPLPIDITINTITNNLCNGDLTGAIDINVTGGTSTYSYLWSDGSSTEDISNKVANAYSVVVTDNNGCTSELDTALSQPPAVEMNINTTDANGAPDGTATTIPSGGVGSYSYLWSTGASTAGIIGLLPGTYTVTVTDGNGCSISDFTIIQNALGLCQIVTDAVNNVTCNGSNNGSIFISTFAAIPLITYQWSNGATTEDISSLAPGNYTVTITDIVACTATQSFIITEPDPLVTTLTPTNTTCGASNGSITSSTIGGTTNYSYLWSNSTTTQNISGLSPNNYTVTVTDAQGCSTVKSAQVGATALPVIVVDSTVNVTCFGLSNGKIYTTGSSGLPPLTYLWSNGSTTDDITGLPTGTYTVTVTDGNLCTATTSATISSPAVLNDSIQSSNPTCGNSNGVITAFPYDGTAAYTYLWSNSQTTQSITGLAPGTYTVTITDANSCSKVTATTLTNIAGPVAVLDSVRNVSCNGGANGGVFISITGGTNPITYLWSNSSTTQDINNVAAATYTVTVTDANLCTSVLTQAVTQPTVLNDSVQSVNPRCGLNNGSITDFPFGGTSPYTYLWSNSQTTQTISSLAPGTYTVTVRDANLCSKTRTVTLTNVAGPVAVIDSVRNVSCNGGANGGVFISTTGGTNPISYLWSNGSTTQDINNVAAATYTVTVTDANLCTAVLSQAVTQPTVLNDSVQSVNPRCGLSNGSITDFPFGGTSPYTYLWSNSQTTQTISSLAPGTYTVTVRDANLCSKTRTVTLTNIAGPVAAIDSVRNVSCNGGANGGVFISTTGGTNPISYLWSNSSTTQDINNVAAATYTVTVTDANLCTAVLSQAVTQPTVLNDSVQSVNPRCGLSNGSITDFPFGGTSPYTYLWSNSQTTQTISSLAPGTYTVTVRDANLCSKTRTVTLTNVAGPVAVIDSVHNVSCNGGANGGVFISTTGGTNPITYLWSNSSTTQDINNVAAATYTVTVTDANLCTAVLTQAVTQPTVLNDSVQSVNPRCGLNNGSITDFPFGGTSPYTYLWSNSQTTQTISSLAPGTYTVTVRDANLCSKTRTLTLTNVAGPVAVIDSVHNVSCNGGATGGVFISTTGGTNPISYLWSNSSTTQDINNVVAATYTVTVTDANLCTAVLSQAVTQPTALNDSVQMTMATCGVANGSITDFPFGGTSPYTYLWSNSQTTQTISALTAGTYTVTVRDANLCSKTRTVVVPSAGGPVAAIDSIHNVICNGGSNGGVFISITGGTNPITYLWSNGATTQDINNVPASVYTVAITDGNSCVTSISATVTQPTALNDSVQSVNPRCGLNNGSITDFPFGGTSPYTYLWSNSQTTQTISSLAPGTYTVTVRDANLCSKTRTVILTNIAGPVAAIDSVRNVSCNGGTNGGVFISTTGGTNPITYLWSNSSTTQDINNVAAATYTVTVTDANLCTAVLSQAVTQPTVLNDSVQSVNPRCGLNNGSITDFPFGGTSPYTYLWSNSQTTQTISSLAPGTYTVTVRDANLCSKTRTVTLINIAGPVAVIDSVHNVSCNGGANGGVFISTTGGTNPISYLWSNSSTTQDINNVTAATYTVTVTDANLCTSVLTQAVTQPTVLNDSVQSVNPRCGLNNGSITDFPFGGTSPYTYLWSNSQTTQTISSLAPGTYTVTVRDANLCSKTRTVTLTNIAGPSAVIDSVHNVSCNGGTNGGVFISTTGGTNPISYLWSNSSTTQDINNVAAATYTVTVTDANLCTAVLSQAVTQPTVLNDSVRVVNSACGLVNGSVTVYPYGGTASYTYLWSNAQTTQSITGVGPGTYTVTITDANSCSKIASGTVLAAGGAVAVIDSVRNVKCNGSATGAIFITVTGGTAPFSYIWSNSAVTQDLQNVVAGTYTVTVTDDNSCTVTLDTVITQPTPLAAGLTLQNARCGLANGTATVNPTGGIGPYTYLWSNSQTTQTATGLAPGNYSVTVTDANLCTKLRTLVITNIPGPTAVVDSIINVKCNPAATGAIYITPSGGTSPITYLWSNSAVTQDLVNVVAGTYTVTVSDANSCTVVLSGTITQPTVLNDSIQVTNANCGAPTGSATVFPYGGTGPYGLLWSTNATTATINGLSAGSYTVTITDSLGCTKTSVANVSNNGGPVVAIDSIKNVKCFGGSNGGIFITVTGGGSPFSYLWSNGATVQDLNGVIAGTYTVTITNINSCVAIVSGTITQPTVLNDTINAVNASCGSANGVLTAYPFGGTTPYSYLWSNAQTTQSITGLNTGLYTVTITDLNGCSKIDSDSIVNLGGPQAAIDSVKNVNCNGNNTGAIFISASGGTGTLSYLWSNSATTEDITGVIAGTYTVTVSDQNSCSVVLSATITQPSLLNDSTHVTPEACGSANGSAVVFAYGGTNPYTYLWSNAQTTSSITNLVAGNYTVTVTDNKSCTKITTVIVPQSSAPVIALDSIKNVTCNAGNNGAIYISVSGGSFPYTYSWSNFAVTQDITGLTAGNYTVIVADQFLCRDTAIFTVTQPTALQDSINFNPANCGLSNGSAKVYPYGGTSPYSYLWSNGQTIQTIVSLTPATYTVTVTDFNQCTHVDSIVVTSATLPQIVTDSIVNVSCNGLSNGAIYISVTGGVNPYQYLWSTSATTDDVSGLGVGSYTVTVTDNSTCSVSQTFNITEPSPIADSINFVNSSCGQANGSMTVFPYGGTPGYTYLWSNAQTTQTITGLVSALYTVTVADLNGCSITSSASISDIGGPTILLDSITLVTCNGGSNGAIYISISSGTGPFTYLWSNSATTEDIAGLTSGNYTVTVTDLNTCQQIANYFVGEPDALSDSLQIVDATCGNPNGGATVFPYGGTSPYTFLWSSGDVTSSVTGLIPGIYTVTVTDSNFCSIVTPVSIGNVGGPVIAIDSIHNVLCYGDSSGAIYITVTGGAFPYDFNWSNGALSEDDVNLLVGTYTVTVSDQNGCTATVSQGISQPDEIAAAFTVTPASCNTSNGAIITTASGGVPGYTYLWSTSATTSGISNLPAGIYTLTITDNNQCVKIFNANISNISAPSISVVDSGNVTCPGQANGFINTIVSGGTQPYNLAWTNTSQTGTSINNLAGNITYTLTVTDSLGCIAILPVFISEPDPISINAFIPQLNGTYNLSCYASDDGSIDLTVTGGTSPYTYLWSNFATAQDIGSLAAGTYTVTVTDDNGCSASTPFTLTQPPLLVSNAGFNKVICGSNTDTLNASVPVFGTGYWTIISGSATFADSTQANTVISNLSNGTNVFQWVVTDGVCSAYSQVVITYNTQIQAIPGIDRNICADSVLLTATTPQFGFGFWQVVASSGVITDTSKGTTIVSGLNPGTNIFRWTVVNGTCSDSADVTIFVKDPADCVDEPELPTGFTPNGDGRNDYYFIKGIDDYPDNSLSVYNRWGNKVFEKNSYKNDWVGANENGDPLPEGTYFVIFKVRAIDKVFTTYVDLRR